MNRLKISAGILLLLGILCVTGLFTLQRQCGKFAAQTEIIMESVKAGDMEKAEKECGELLVLWEEFHDRTGIFIDGERLDPIRELLAGLPALIEAEHPEVMSHLEALRTLAEDLFLEELPDLWHIL